MDYIQVYRGDTLRINLSFTNSDGTPYILSGCTLYYTVKRNYSDSDADAIISKTVTGFDAPESGLAAIDLTSTDTSQCCQDYFAGFTLTGGTGIFAFNQTFNTDGLRILPSPRGL